MTIYARIRAMLRKPAPQTQPAPEYRPVQFSWSRPDWYDEAAEAARLEEDEWARLGKE